MTIAVTRTGVPATSPAAGNTAVPDGTVQYVSVGALELESGAVLPEVVLAYETWGTLNADASNAVLIEHALTGDTHVTRGAGGEPGWWEQLAGPGAPVDTDRYFVVSINILGGCYGSTGPSTPAPDGRPWGSRFPLVTLRDSTAAEARMADALGINRWHAVLGGSLGGARALEWAVSYPERVGRCAVIAVGAYSTAEQIAFAQAQTLAIRQDPRFNGGDYYGGPEPHEGLALARRIAHITYRSAAELEGRFGRTGQDGETPLAPGPLSGRGRYQVESYLDHQGNKLVQRFDANSYIAITEALMSHDVARGRGSLQQALAGATAEFFIAAVDSDRLYFPEQSRELAAALPGEVPVHVISAPIGHDGFLTEIGQLGGVLREAFFA
ncbi:homoserine O-acetyltransferase [Arthrobacter sp. 1P04PC]|uniref:homoserine O-acetyltransferase MetX n=1 Tax=unclassified Arthrobacter TaxID=235627 RepID=UPI0039A1A9F5